MPMDGERGGRGGVRKGQGERTGGKGRGKGQGVKRGRGGQLKPAHQREVYFICPGNFKPRKEKCHTILIMIALNKLANPSLQLG